MARRIYTDYQGVANRNQERGHGPTHSIEFPPVYRIKPPRPAQADVLRVPVVDILAEKGRMDQIRLLAAWA